MTTTRKRLVPAAVAVLVASSALAACGGSGSYGATSPPRVTPRATPAHARVAKRTTAPVAKPARSAGGYAY